MQCDESHKAPHALIKEAGVYERTRLQTVAADNIHAGHAEYPVGAALCAEGFLVDEVAPSAYALSDEESERGNIRHRAEVDLAYLAHHEAAEESSDNAAVNGETAVPYGRESGDDIKAHSGIRVEGLEHAVVDTRAEESHDERHEYHVEHSVLAKSEVLSAPHRVEVRENHADGDEHAVPVYLYSEKLEALIVAQGYTAEKIREGQLHLGEGGG